MKISVDDKPLFELNETQIKVIMNDIHEDIFVDDMKRRLQYILMHKYERCYERLEKEWMEKFRSRNIASIPMNKDEFAELVFSQPDYRSRKAREVEAQRNNK